jgi:hypothetical protein
MSMEGPGGPGSRDPGAQRWGAEKEQIDRGAVHHLAHEAERIHAEEAAEMAAERGEAPNESTSSCGEIDRPWGGRHDHGPRFDLGFGGADRR